MPLRRLKIDNLGDVWGHSNPVTLATQTTQTIRWASAPANMPTIAEGSTECVPITVAPNTPSEERVWVTAYTRTADPTSASCLRGQETSTASAHTTAAWAHAPTAWDFGYLVTVTTSKSVRLTPGTYLIELTGAGGGGGPGSGLGSNGAGGAGGGAGNTLFFFLSVAEAATYRVTVGAGGTGGTAGLTPTAGTTGGTTAFKLGASTLAAAPGGGGGRPGHGMTGGAPGTSGSSPGGAGGNASAAGGAALPGVGAVGGSGGGGSSQTTTGGGPGKAATSATTVLTGGAEGGWTSKAQATGASATVPGCGGGGGGAGAGLVVTGTTSTTLETPIGVAVSGTRAYVVDQGAERLLAFTISAAAAVLLGQSAQVDAGFTGAIAIVGVRAFVGDSDGTKLYVFTVSGDTPVKVGTVVVGAHPGAVVALPGTRVLVAGGKRLTVYTAKHNTPVKLGTLTSTTVGAPSAATVAVSGTRAFIGSGSSAVLRAFTVSGDTPVKVGTVVTSADVESVAAEGDVVVVGLGRTVATYTVRGNTPVLVGSVTPTTTQAVACSAIAGNAAFIGRNSGVSVFTVKGAPVQIETRGGALSYPSGMATASGTRLVVVTHTTGVHDLALTKLVQPGTGGAGAPGQARVWRIG